MEYYIKINEEKRGPYSLNELAERKLDETSLVMPTDGVEWVPANQIEELRTLFESKDLTDNPVKTEDIPFVEARPIIQAAPQEAAQQAQPAPKKKSHTGCLIGILLTLVALVAVMIVTCPKTEQHKEVLSTVITTTVNDAVNDNDNITGNTFIDNAFRTVSNAFAGKVIETAVDNLVTVDNYVVCSLGKVHYDGKDNANQSPKGTANKSTKKGKHAHDCSTGNRGNRCSKHHLVSCEISIKSTVYVGNKC